MGNKMRRPYRATGLLNCQRCPLAEERTRVVPGYGEQPSNLMYVAQSPGSEEDWKGIPLVGRSGKLLDEINREVGITDFFKTNINLCHPQSNRKASPKEQAACRPWLNAQIQDVDPDVIVALGDAAYRAFLPDEPSPITQIQGAVFHREIEGRMRAIIPTVHPAFVIRNLPAHRARFTEDIQKVKDILDGVIQTTIPFRETVASWQEIHECISEDVDLPLGFDLETTGLHRTSDVIGFGICKTIGNGLYYPTRRPEHATYFQSESTLQSLKPWLEDPDRIKIVSNAKFEKHILAQLGITLRGAYDTLIESWLLGDVPLALKDAIQRVFGIEMIRIESLLGPEGPNQKNMWDAFQEDPAAVIRYAAQDPDASLRLHQYQAPLLKERGLWDLYTKVELPFTDVVVEMERTGMLFVPELLIDARNTLVTHYAELVDNLNTMLGIQGCYFCDCDADVHLKTVCKGCTDPDVRKHKYGGFNPKSPKQSAEVLFDREHEWRIVSAYAFNTRSTDKTTLGEHLDNELVRGILEARAVEKMRGTYVDALPQHIEPDGRIHCQINQTRVVTGRISSSKPNLTNIPARDREDVNVPVQGKEIRKAFVAGEGNWIYAPDLKQIELRVEAHLSGDESLIDAFLNGRDPHTEHTEAIYELTKEDVDPVTWDNMRYTAKMIGFGVLFGLTPHGLVLRTPALHLSPEQAEIFINRFFDRRPGIKIHQEEIVRSGRDLGYVESLLGRVRWMPELTSDDRKTRLAAEREAINFPVQAGAADIFKTCLLRVKEARDYWKMRTRFINQVHDEIDMEGPQGELEQVATILVPRMESAVELIVPTPVDLDYGKDWGSLITWKP